MIVRETVRFVRERLAGAKAAGVGISAAVLVLLAVALATRRRRRRHSAESAGQAGAAYEKMTARLLANLSHELYTPLTPVKGYLSILKHRELPPQEIHEVADRMSDASDRLQRVLEALVGFAEVQRGDFDPTDAVRMDDLIDECVAHVTPDDAHRISVHVEGRLPAVRADKRLVGLAIWSLIDNAVKFSPHGGAVHIDVRSSSDESGRTLVVTVADEGIGMSDDQLKVAFTPFRQVDDSTTRPFGGLGIGIALADRVARVHGGRLLATSRPNGGSSFVLSIPLIPAQRPLAVAST